MCTNLERPAQPTHRAVHHLAHPPLLRAISKPAGLTDHPPVLHLRSAVCRQGCEERLDELGLGRDRLVDPCEHVAGVPQRVVRVQLDGAWEPARSAAGERVEEGAEEGRCARLREGGERLATAMK